VVKVRKFDLPVRVDSAHPAERFIRINGWKVCLAI